MKLVDILALELKAWPDGAFAITQDYDLDINQVMHDFTTTLNEAGRVWRANPGMLEISTFETKRQSDDYSTAIITRAEWQAAVDSLNAPKVKPSRNTGELTFGDLIAFGYLAPPESLHHQRFARVYCFEQQPEWSEDGLPNVGTKCVIYKGTHGLAAGAEEFIGPVVTVTARFKSARGIEMACVDSGDDGGGCHVFRADMCFHLPTAEEIAAEERDKKAFDLFCSLAPWLSNPEKTWAGMSSIAKKAYLATIDAGWQQVTK